MNHAGALLNLLSLLVVAPELPSQEKAPPTPIDRLLEQRSDLLSHSEEMVAALEQRIESAKNQCRAYVRAQWGSNPPAEKIEDCHRWNGVNWMEQELREHSVRADYYRGINKAYLEGIQARLGEDFVRDWADSGSLGVDPLRVDDGTISIRTPIEVFRTHREQQRREWREHVRRSPELAGAAPDTVEAFPAKDPQAVRWMQPAFVRSLQRFGAGNPDVRVEMPAPRSLDDLNELHDTDTASALRLEQDNRIPRPGASREAARPIRRDRHGDEFLVDPLDSRWPSTADLHRGLADDADRLRLTPRAEALLSAARQFQGIPYSQDNGCTHFDEMLVRELHPGVSDQTVQRIHMSDLGGRTWEETQANIARAIAAERSRQRGIGDGDPRVRGVVHALVSANLADEISPRDVEVGDVIQYWYKDGKNEWHGHSGIVFGRSRAKPNEIRIYGAHEKGAGRVAVSTIPVDLTKDLIYSARIHDDVVSRYRARRQFSEWVISDK